MDFLSKRETARSLPQCQQEADGRLLAHDTHAIEEGQEGVVVYPVNFNVPPSKTHSLTFNSIP